jgi:mannose-1-phosphate guanylyltransferase
MLHIWLQVCERAGIDEVLINLHAHAGVVREFLECHETPVKVHVSEESILLGSAGTLRANREWVGEDSAFWVLYGDVLTTADLRGMAAFHRRRQPAATMGLYQVPDPSRCGVVHYDEQQVVRGFEEKPAHPKSNWVFSGLLLATPEMLESIPDRAPADLGFDVLPHLVNRMLAYPIHDYLIDVGTMENYRAAQTTWPGLAPQKQSQGAC